jgi:hypothetical protein
VTTTPDFPTITSRLSLSRVLDVTEGAIRRAEAEGRIRRTRAGEWDVLDVVRAWRANTRRHVGTPLPAWLDSDVDLDEGVLRQLAFRARQEARRSQGTPEEVAADRAVERLLDELVGTAAAMDRWNGAGAFWREGEGSPHRDHHLDVAEVRAALAAVPHAGEWLQHAWFQGSEYRSVWPENPYDETWNRRAMVADAVSWIVLLHRRMLAHVSGSAAQCETVHALGRLAG